MQATSLPDLLASPLWLFTGLLLLAGLAMLLVGWRGRRINDHPICRKCGFDLYGKPADSDTCSECGADVGQPKAIRAGRRKRQRGLIGVGIVFMLIGVAGVGIGGWAAGQQINWTPWLPLTWIAADLDSAAWGTYDPAATEINRRLTTNSLSSNQIDWLISTALAKQADRTVPWPQGWQEVLDDLLVMGLLDSDQIEKYLTQVAAPELKIKPTLRRGRSVSLMLDGHWDRFTPSTRITGTQRSTPMTLGGAVILKNPFDSNSHGAHGGFGSYGVGRHLSEKSVAEIPDGPHTLTITMQYRVSMFEPVAAGPFTLEHPLSLSINLAGKDAVVDTFETDPSLRSAVHAAVLDARVQEDDKGKVAVSIRTDPPPLPLAMAVHLRQDDQEQRVGTLRVHPTTNAQWHRVWTGEQPIFTDGEVDVILRPSQDAADNTLTLDTYWGEEIVLENIGVNAPRQVVFNQDMTLRPAVEASLNLDRLTVAGTGSKRLRFFVGAHQPPVKLAYRVIARSGKKQSVDQSDVTFMPGNNFSYGIHMALPDPDAATVDIILQPDPEWEVNTNDLTPPWGGEVVFKDVPLPTEPDTPSGPIRPTPIAETAE